MSRYSNLRKLIADLRAIIDAGVVIVRSDVSLIDGGDEETFFKYADLVADPAVRPKDKKGEVGDAPL